MRQPLVVNESDHLGRLSSSVTFAGKNPNRCGSPRSSTTATTLDAFLPRSVGFLPRTSVPNTFFTNVVSMAKKVPSLFLRLQRAKRRLYVFSKMPPLAHRMKCLCAVRKSTSLTSLHGIPVRNTRMNVSIRRPWSVRGLPNFSGRVRAVSPLLAPLLSSR